MIELYFRLEMRYKDIGKSLTSQEINTTTGRRILRDKMLYQHLYTSVKLERCSQIWLSTINDLSTEHCSNNTDESFQSQQYGLRATTVFP